MSAEKTEKFPVGSLVTVVSSSADYCGPTAIVEVVETRSFRRKTGKPNVRVTLADKREFNASDGHMWKMSMTGIGYYIRGVEPGDVKAIRHEGAVRRVAMKARTVGQKGLRQLSRDELQTVEELLDKALLELPSPATEKT